MTPTPTPATRQPCPNGCGPMYEVPFGQQCAKCGWPCVPVKGVA